MNECFDNILMFLSNHQGRYAKWKISWNMYTLHARLRTFGTDLQAQSVLISKILGSELRRKFIKSALLVGYVVFNQYSDIVTKSRVLLYLPILPCVQLTPF